MLVKKDGTGNNRGMRPASTVIFSFFLLSSLACNQPTVGEPQTAKSPQTAPLPEPSSGPKLPPTPQPAPAATTSEAASAASPPRVQTITLLAGLPHPRFQHKLFQKEKAAKATTAIEGHLFYQGTRALSPADDRRLHQLVSDASSFKKWRPGKRCGGFHADYAASWSKSGRKRTVLICFGCHEALVIEGTKTTHFDLERKAYDQIKALLKPVRKD